jgi:TetR/AcrR family transcriptional regulator, lmrAB and yxaGH operons repressor
MAGGGRITGGHEPGILDRAEAAFNATSDALAEHFRQAGLTPDDARRRAMLAG